MRIALIQSSLHWQDRQANLDMLDALIDQVLNADLVLLPEMFSTGFSMTPDLAEDAADGPSIRWMKAAAARKGLAVAGSLMVAENGHAYNRFYFVTPEGDVHTYDKRHLFSLAEEEKYFTPGHHQVIITYKGWKIAPMVCYDLRFPVWARRSAGFDYDLLIYTANWPEQRNHAWKTLLMARAIENQAYVAGINRVGTDGTGKNYSGDSAVHNALGQPLVIAPAGEEGVYYAELDKPALNELRSTLPFYNDRDHFRFSE